jgi:hypothetical protein
MPTAREIVQGIVKCQEDRVSTSWPHPERRLALLEICRAIDTVVLSAKHQREEVVELCRQGANKAVSLFVDDSCNESRTPLFASNDATFRWAQSALQLCGQIASCEKLLDYEQSGLGEFSGHREALRFDFTALNAGMEALEQGDFERLVDSQGHVRRPLYDAMDSALPQVHERMRSLVYRWSDHYIGYTAEPEIDAYYQQRGLLAAKRMSAQDTFDDASEFGGLPFGLYKAVVLVLVGWTIKHADFALLLKEQYPDLHLRNLITLTADVKTIAGELACALDITTEEASQALGVLELNPGNVKELCINGHAIPPLIRAASEQFIKPISGFLIEPFVCMNRNLRIKFRSDWDRHVNQREPRFRTDLFNLFPQSWLKKLPKSVVLKQDRQILTDIDALIVDERNHVAGLFQLKWQEGFGHSMRERSAKMRNFCREACCWTDAVMRFLATRSPRDVNQLLGLSKSSQPIECLLFIVGRYFAHFSGDASMDDRAAYGHWVQVIQLSQANGISGDPIRTLHSALKADSPLKRKVSVPTESFQIGDSVITLTGIDR